MATLHFVDPLIHRRTPRRFYLLPIVTNAAMNMGGVSISSRRRFHFFSGTLPQKWKCWIIPFIFKSSIISGYGNDTR